MSRLLNILVVILQVFMYPLMSLAQDASVKEGEESSAELADQYQSIRALYRSLIIEDLGGKDVERWFRVEASLKDFIDKNESDRVYKPRAQYLLGRFYEQRSKYSGSEDDIQGALSILEKLALTFPGDDLADDALLGIARIREGQGKLFEAKEALSKIISDYGASDSMSHAQKHYTEIETKMLGLTKPSPVQVVQEDRLTNEIVTLGSLEEKHALVLIDPGHGGDEDGALGPGGIREKDITLALSLLVRDLLKEDGRVRVQLTRVDDVTLTLANRTSIANEIKADLFVSIHTNASEYKASRGVETYYLDNTDDKSSLRLAERENFIKSDVSKSSLSFIVSDFIQGIKMDDSISLAHMIQDALVLSLKKDHPSIKNLGVKRAPFYVLVGAHMPCVLTEVSFIDHPEEGRLLATPTYQKLVAEGIYKGIVTFLKKKMRY